ATALAATTDPRGDATHAKEANAAFVNPQKMLVNHARPGQPHLPHTPARPPCDKKTAREPKVARAVRAAMAGYPINPHGGGNRPRKKPRAGGNPNPRHGRSRELQNGGRGRRLRENGVVPRSAIEHVGAPAADEHVVPRAAAKRVVAWAAGEHIVSVAAIGRELNSSRGEGRGVEGVIAGLGADRELVVGR